MLPQIRLEPILHQRAVELNPTSVIHGTEVTSIKQDGSDNAKHAPQYRDGCVFFVSDAARRIPLGGEL
ncbi:hypothetical protein BBP40_006163 [Aspergillus hancockii]|nr:hypothetical protein BBP40_006163 [Aspergillus hancockii]